MVDDVHDETDVLRVAAVTVGYDRTPVIADVAFCVRRGDCMGLLGVNGAGKSTLLRAITGQLPLRSGQVWISGVDLGRYPERAKRGFGYAVDGASLPMTLTGAEYLELVASIRGCHPRDWPFGDMIEPLGLRKWLGEPIGACSLGTQMKLSIAAALLDTPPLIILDESLNGLDPVAAWQVKRMVAAIMRTGRHGVVLATHVLETITSVCNCAMFIEAGRVAHRWDSRDLALAVQRPDGFEGHPFQGVAARALASTRAVETWARATAPSTYPLGLVTLGPRLLVAI